MSAREAYTAAELVVVDLLNEARRPLERLEARLEGVPGAEAALSEVQQALVHIKGAWMFHPVTPKVPR